MKRYIVVFLIVVFSLGGMGCSSVMIEKDDFIKKLDIQIPRSGLSEKDSRELRKKMITFSENNLDREIDFLKKSGKKVTMNDVNKITTIKYISVISEIKKRNKDIANNKKKADKEAKNNRRLKAIEDNKSDELKSLESEKKELEKKRKISLMALNRAKAESDKKRKDKNNISNIEKEMDSLRKDIAKIEGKTIHYSTATK